MFERPKDHYDLCCSKGEQYKFLYYYFFSLSCTYKIVQAHHHHLINDTIPTFFIIRVSFYCLYTSFMITKKIMVYALSTKENKK